MHPRREQVVLMHALMKVGATVLPLSPRLTAAERATVVEAEHPIVDLDDAGELTQTEADMPLLGEHDMDDVCCRVLTSGSTGTPRPIPLSYGNFLWNAVGSGFNLGVLPDDRWLCCVPLSHIAGLGIVMRSVIDGAAAVVHDGFDVDRVGEALERDGITQVSLVATMLTRLLEAGVDLSGPRAILVGGGPVPDEVRRPGVLETYGMTETTSMAALDGFPLPGVDIAIAADGEILVTGPIVAGGGTHRSGDLGELRDGRLVVTGRKSETIITGGENVSPAEVEGVLAAHPGVRDAAVVGRPDPVWGEALVALVVGDAGERKSVVEGKR